MNEIPANFTETEIKLDDGVSDLHAGMTNSNV